MDKYQEIIMKRSYYSDSIERFLNTNTDEILGKLTKNSDFDLGQAQRDSWIEEISILKSVLSYYTGAIYFEYSIPRMGKRIDVVLLIDSIIFVLEFKIGEKQFTSYAIDQVYDYALDLKNFHETSHNQPIAPILIATGVKNCDLADPIIRIDDNLFSPIRTNDKFLNTVIKYVLQFSPEHKIDQLAWEKGRYCPTPTIIEAAMALYNSHSVNDISRNDASAKNLSITSESISEIISYSKTKYRKSICFVTGVPGAGKTLVGLNIATKYIDKSSDLHSVFLSGNGPLVSILREALARDKVQQSKERGIRIRKGIAMSEVKMFIQNVHNFRDDCLDNLKPPLEHVVLFDEAQRAWNKEQTTNFMRRKKNKPNFNRSESEFLISCLDRHTDWAVIVCLVGGGQEINTGEAGISEWLASLNNSFKDWDIYISAHLTDSEYNTNDVLDKLKSRININLKNDLHLAVSMRSFRAEHVSLLVKQLLDLENAEAYRTLIEIQEKYPIVLTRNLAKAKQWLRSKARGSERYGLVVSSQAERLKPYAIDVKSPMEPIHWFLDGKEDVRSSYYLEDVATEFDIQGLELDWAGIIWDADFRHSNEGWNHWSFCGDRWNHIRKPERQSYQKNAYRVLLTRARQGMVIVVPEGDAGDPTRKKEYYDPTYEYLKEIGFTEI
ncbi:MAG: DUF2075 domain-containing protein [Elusimicrobiota bacterium]